MGAIAQGIFVVLAIQHLIIVLLSRMEDWHQRSADLDFLTALDPNETFLEDLHQRMAGQRWKMDETQLTGAIIAIYPTPLMITHSRQLAAKTIQIVNRGQTFVNKETMVKFVEEHANTTDPNVKTVQEFVQNVCEELEGIDRRLQNRIR